MFCTWDEIVYWYERGVNIRLVHKSNVDIDKYWKLSYGKPLPAPALTIDFISLRILPRLLNYQPNGIDKRPTYLFYGWSSTVNMYETLTYRHYLEKSAIRPMMDFSGALQILDDIDEILGLK